LRTLVLGLGNPILTDDGVGIHVVRSVARRLRGTDVDVREASLGGLRLLDVVAGYERLVLVDAIQTGGPPGQVHRLGADCALPSLHAASSHDVGLPAAFDLARRLGMTVPADEDIVVVAVEVEDVWTFGERCTPSVRAAIPRAAQVVFEELLADETYPRRG